MSQNRSRRSPWRIFHWLVLGTLTVVLGNTLLSMLIFRRPRKVRATDQSAETDAPIRVSVLIPARNEERRLEPLLASMDRQTVGGLEVIVLDDHSTDGTRELAESYGYEEQGVAPKRLLRGADLPAGWTGKSWACWQLAQAARGEWLVFTDADTIHEPECIASAVAHAERTGADMLSLWPRQITETLSEKLVVPFFYVLILSFLPQFCVGLLQKFPALARRTPRPFLTALGAANGQMLLFRRSHYFGVGGHKAVHGHMVEDVALSRLTMEATGEGRRLVNADGSELLSCRMYTGFADLWEGFSKNLRPAFRHPWVFVAFGAYQWLTWIQPFILLLMPGAWAQRHRPLVAAQVGIIYAIRALFVNRFQSSRAGAALHPVGHMLALIIATNSWRLTTTKGVTWKGRRYQVDGSSTKKSQV